MLDIDDKAVNWLADQGYDPAYGARPLRRVIQKEVQDKLAGLILAGEVLDGTTVNVRLKGDTLDFSTAKSLTPRKNPNAPKSAAA